MTNPTVKDRARTVMDQGTGEAMALVPLDNADAFSMQQYLANITSDDAINMQKELASAYDKAVSALVGPNDEQVEGKRKFKKKSAWRKLQRHFRISTEIVESRFSEVSIVGSLHAPARVVTVALVRVRAIAPWGMSAEAIGGCGMDEETPDTEGTYEDSGRSFTKRGKKLSLADMAATAETRATNRCVSNLIAAGEVSAEEMRRGSQASGGYDGGSDRRFSESAASAGSSRAPASDAFDPDAVMDRGKHNGKTFRAILVADKQYLAWLLDSEEKKAASNDRYARPQTWVDGLRAFLAGGPAPATGTADTSEAPRSTRPSRATKAQEFDGDFVVEDEDDDLPF